jgi:polar amino acid transport system permease protein
MSFVDILAALSRGAVQTMVVTVACAATGLGVGLGIAILRRLKVPGLNALLAIFVYVFRGIPVLVLLFLVFFGLPATGFEVGALTSMMLSLGLVAGAYLAEVFRGALESVDPIEITAAEAMGLSRLQTLLSIEIPQMLRFSVPGMINEFTTVMKYSPFAYTVGIPEITKQAMALTSTTLRGIEIYLAVGIFYFAVYRSMLALIRLLESRYRIPGIGQA